MSKTTDMLMRLAIAVIFFAMMCACFVVFRPKPFFDDKGHAYGFGLTSATSRPYSLLVLFLAFATLSYFFAANFAESAV